MSGQDRRGALGQLLGAGIGFHQIVIPPAHAQQIPNQCVKLREVRDPKSYSALGYQPPQSKSSSLRKPPLIVVLHGAGRNTLDIFDDLADSVGEHAGLIPSLIASEKAPKVLLDNFAVLAPYSFGKPSFYEDSRSKILDFIDWAGTDDCPIDFDPNRIFLFGFSDGATVAVELMTTRRFKGAVICSYGYTGVLPPRAVERLSNLPMWVFHSQDDVIFSATNSDRLVEQLKRATDNPSQIKYTKFEKDPENLPSRVRGHSMGITASKSEEVYLWLLALSDNLIKTLV